MSASNDEISIMSLAQRISSLSVQITAYLNTNSHPEPIFTTSEMKTPESLEYEALRGSLNDAALDLLQLINGPKNTLRNLIFSHYDLAALQVALDRRFFDHVPLPSTPGSGEVLRNGEKQAWHDDSASVTEIANKAGMDEDRTGRVLKLLATHRIFEEVEGKSGWFKHTANSALLARDAGFNATADMQMDDMLKAASELSTLISRSPYASDTTNSAFHEKFGVSMYQYYEQNPKKAERFGQAMSSWSQIDNQLAVLRDSFPWASLKDGRVVDIGGGSGHVSIALARQFPSLRFVVQDISSHMLSHAQEDLGGRVTFQQYNFFDPQPVHDASVFLLRQCLHNHNDADSVRILRAVVPALESCGPGTLLLINDIIMPDGGTVPRCEEHHLRQVDLCMMVALGAKQRSGKEFENLLREADSRFQIVNIHRNALGVGLLEVCLGMA